MRIGDVIYDNDTVLIASASFNKEEPCKECFFYDGHECQSNRYIECWEMLEIGIALGLKGAISCIFGSLSKDDCNIKDEIIDISKHIKEKLISDNHG